MADVLKAFQFISEHVPAWLRTLEQLTDKVNEREAHVGRLPVSAHKLKKTGSNESLRPNSRGNDVAFEILSAPQDGDLANPIDEQTLLSKSRKRKTTSIASNDSIPSKYRTRSMIIVYYDSEIQKSFEQVVRVIGTARNGLRRAKTTTRLEVLSNAQSIASLVGSQQPAGDDSPLVIFRSPRGPTPRPPLESKSTPEQTDTLSQTDLALEKAQSLCERGAHQFLREGDCEAEIEGAKNCFLEAKKISDREVSRLQQEMIDKATIEKEEESKKEELSTHLDQYLHNSGSVLEVDDDSSEGEDTEDPMMVLARLRAHRRGGAPATVPV